MRLRLLILGLLSICIGFIVLACGKSQDNAANQTVDASQVRPTPPVDYASMQSPQMNAVDLSEGKKLYKTNCTTCHGDTGLGDGPAASALDPKPQPLAHTVAGESDAYLFWRISTGGSAEPFKSAMPAWKTVLNEQQIWQLIAYLRKLSE
jgi:mono/diheme cytochrome c family protein